MIPVIIAGAAILSFGAIALYGSLKSTASKVEDGDSVFVKADQISLEGPPSPASSAALTSFLAGFVTTLIKVSRVTRSGTQGKGTIEGFPQAVVFPLEAVAMIDRNGTRIT